LRTPVLFLIRQYQRWLAPLNRGACRHIPSCSEYAHEAVERHGVARGVWLAAKRLSRCHPLGTHGVDFVP
jgi:putative membrane protein insertion efficiency factor